MQVKIFENLAGVDRQFATQLDQKLLTGGIGSEEGSSNLSMGNANISIMERPDMTQADNSECKPKTPSESSSAGGVATKGYASLKSRLVDVAESEELVQQELQTKLLNEEVDSLAIARSVYGSPFVGSLESEVVELDSPRKEMEKQIWIDRVKDSEKGSTSSSSSGSARNSKSGIRSLAKPAKLSRPSRGTAKEDVLSVLEVSGEAASLQRRLLQPSLDRREGGDKETVLETHQDRERDSDARVELAKVRKDIASGKVVEARSSLQKVRAYTFFEIGFLVL